MNWKQLAKAVVDEVKAWANERFADLDKVRALIGAEVRELRDAQSNLAKDHHKLYADFTRHAAAPAPTATVDTAVVTAAVAGWFEKNPPPVPKDGTSVELEELQPFLQAGLAKWQLEFERNASAVLQRFLEKLRQPKDGDPGKDASPEQIAVAVAQYLTEHPPKPGTDGKSITPAELEAAFQEALKHYPPPAGPSAGAISAAVAEYLAAHPPAKGDPGPGATAAEVGDAVAAYLARNPPAKGKDGEPGRAPTAAEVGDAVALHLAAHPIRVPADGRGPTVEELAAAIEAHFKAHPLPQLDAEVMLDSVLATTEDAVAKWLAKNPPKDAPPPTPEQLAPLVAAYLEAHPPPKGKDGDDGQNVTPELLAASLAEYFKLAPIQHGKDGTSVTLDEVRPLFEAAFAQWALEFERRAADVFERAVDRLEKPKDGRDGLNVDNFGLELDEDGRTLRFVLSDGERRHVHAIRLPIPLDRGVFKDNGRYERGDVVTFGGSMWIAQKNDPAGRPGSSVDWRLAVKHGRDAKK